MTHSHLVLTLVIHSFILFDLYSLPYNGKAFDVDCFVPSSRSSTCSLPLNKLGILGGREATPRHQRIHDVRSFLTSTPTIGQLGKKGVFNEANTSGISKPPQTLAEGATSQVYVPPQGV